MYKIRVLALMFGIWFISFMQIIYWICLFPVFSAVFIFLPKIRSKVFLDNFKAFTPKII